MSPEMIGGIVASILAIVAASAGTYARKRKMSLRPPPPAAPQQLSHRGDHTGPFRLVEQIDRDQVSLETLDVVTQLYRQFAELNKDNARDAMSRETVALVAEKVEAIYSRARRLATSEDIRELSMEVRELRRTLESRGTV